MIDQHKAEVVIVGAGEAGARCAIALRTRGFDGSLLLIGAEQVPTYERPPLSKAVLTRDIAASPEVMGIDRAAALGIEMRLGTRVTAVDSASHRVEFTDGSVHEYGTLVLATGAQARRLGVPGGERALVLRTDDDATAIRSRLQSAQRLVVIEQARPQRR